MASKTHHFFADTIKPQGLKAKSIMFLTSGFANLTYQSSGHFALKFLFKPYSRRDYVFKTQKPVSKLYFVKTLKGQVALNYFEGQGDKHIFLSHGWADTSVRFTQLIDELLNQGFHIWSIDQVGHGKSSHDSSNLFDFIDGVKNCIEFIENKGHQIEALIGHSMGSLAVLNQSSSLLENKKVVMVAAPTKFFENLFVNTKKMGFSNKMLLSALEHVSKFYQKSWEELSPIKHTYKINSHFLMVHDKEDPTCSYENFKELVKGIEHEFLSTSGLGHLKILKDKGVLSKISSFITDKA